MLRFHERKVRADGPGEAGGAAVEAAGRRPHRGRGQVLRRPLQGLSPEEGGDGRAPPRDGSEGQEPARGRRGQLRLEVGGEEGAPPFTDRHDEVGDGGLLRPPAECC